MNYSKRTFLGAVTLSALLLSFFSPNLIAQRNLSVGAVPYAEAAGGYSANSPAYYPYTLATPIVDTLNGKKTVTLSWGASLSGVTYSVTRKSSQGNVWTTIVSGLTGRQYIDKLTSAGKYTYQIKAINSYGTGYSSIQVVTVVLGTVTTDPSIITPAPTPTPTPVPTPSPVTGNSAINGVTNRLVWGAYLGDGNGSGFESLVGHKMDMQADFVGWGSGGAFPGGYGSTARDQGKTLFLYWEQYDVTLDAIISGSQDAYIKQFAASAKAYGGPVILAPFHEMNGDWTPWSGVVGNNTPSKVISAWQHIHDLMSGISNVKFAWVINGDSVPDTSANAIAKYWPGASYVDYVGLDNFNGPAYSSALSFDVLFGNAIQTTKGYGKPILITSTACAPNGGKPAWITNALSVSIKKYPSVIGWMWFNENKEANWTVNSDMASLNAFKAAIPM